MKTKKFTNAEICRLRLQAEKTLTKIDGVVGVGYGLKEKGGMLTDEKALRVYVSKKRDRGILGSKEILPLIYGGLPIDVCEVQQPSPIAGHCHDLGGNVDVAGGYTIVAYPEEKVNEWNRILRDGILKYENENPDNRDSVRRFTQNFTEFIQDPTRGIGTGGGVFEIKIDDHDKYAILTNHHVLHPAKNGDYVYSVEVKDQDRTEDINGDGELDPPPIVLNEEVVANYAKLREFYFNSSSDSSNPNTEPSNPVAKDSWYKILGSNFKDFLKGKYYGRVHLKADRTINYPMEIPEHGGIELKYYLDCGYVHINTDWSSTCRKYKGVKFKTEIIDRNTIGTDEIKISGVRSLTCDDIGKTVFKIGGRSNKTTGKIVDIFSSIDKSFLFKSIMTNPLTEIPLFIDKIVDNQPAQMLVIQQALTIVIDNLDIITFQEDNEISIAASSLLKAKLSCLITQKYQINTSLSRLELANDIQLFLDTYKFDTDKQNIIVIKADGNNCEGNYLFADRGDSGSLLLTEQNELVGLVFSRNYQENDEMTLDEKSYGFACHIAPVLKYLNLKAIISPSGQRSASLNSEVETLDSPSVEDTITFDNLMTAILEKENGELLYESIQKLRPEVIQLVHHSRPVKVAWYRNNGPAFAAHFEKSILDPSYTVPEEIKNVALPMLLKSMSNVLFEHGSIAIKQALNIYSEGILSNVGYCRNFSEFVSSICKYSPNEQLARYN